MHIYNEIHVLLLTITIEHTMTHKAQEHGGGSSQDYPTEPNSWNRKGTFIPQTLLNM